MTTGAPAKVITGFTIPVYLGNLFQHLYNMVDAIIVGQFIGSSALAAVGSVGTIMFLMNGFLSGMTTGFTVLTAQYFGAGDDSNVRKSVISAGILSFFAAGIISVVSLRFMRTLLIYMNTPSDIFEYAYQYMIVICVGIFAQTAYNLSGNILRAMGNSKIPLYFLILAAILNIILDLIFIIVFQMGTRGAAIATVAAQGTSAICCLGYIIWKMPVLRFARSDCKMDFYMIRDQLRMGIPMALQFSITAVGTMMVQSALNILGSATVAAYTAAVKIEQMITQGFIAMGAAMTSYCAQNRGAMKFSRIRAGVRVAGRLGIGYAAVTGLILWTIGKYAACLFITEDIPAMLQSVEIYLRCTAIFMPFLMLVDLLRNSIQGMGYGLLPMLAGVAELIGRGIVSQISAKYRSYFGVCMAGPAAWILASVVVLVVYFIIMRNFSKSEKAKG